MDYAKVMNEVGDANYVEYWYEPVDCVDFEGEAAVTAPSVDDEEYFRDYDESEPF